MNHIMFWIAFALLAVGPLRAITAIVCYPRGEGWRRFVGVATSVAHAVLCVLCCVWLLVRF